MGRRLLLIAAFSFIGCYSFGIVPLPQKVTYEKGVFEFDAETQIVLLSDDGKIRNAINVFKEIYTRSTGFDLRVSSDKTSSKNVIVFQIDKKVEKEGYRLQVSPRAIKIKSSGYAGFFYALQTIRQLLPPQIESAKKIAEGIKWLIPCVSIYDFPEFGYRGMHLDVARHFMPIEFVKKYIDMLAFHKLNTFHWHLTDDQGWRIEIKKYSKLTEIGAVRRMEINGHRRSPDWTWRLNEHSGYYTQDEIKEIIDYAQKRNVIIIPEIELPGHALAALAAYPELSCSGGPFEVVGRWGVFHDIFCSREETINFLQDVVVEVADLFPGEYIHIGGDEVPKTRWERCNACQERMKSENIESENQLQAYFINRIEETLREKGKKIICWDEALDANIPQSITIMSWRGEEGGIKALKSGNDVIMTPHKMVYFDYCQGPKEKEPLAQGGFLPLEQVYGYSPVPEQLTKEEAGRIKGVQANVWTEYMYDEKQVEYMAFPRIAAMAEVAWTQSGNKNYEDFRNRLKSLLIHYDYLNINYRKLDD